MRYAFREFELDTETFELRHTGAVLSLEPKAFNVLQYLLEHRDRVVPKDELLQQLWPEQAVTDWALTYCLNQIRKAVDDTGRKNQVIKTVHGRGYHFVASIVSQSTHAPEQDHDGEIPWNIPAFNPFFTGRDQLLETIREGFLTQRMQAVMPPQAISGLGGIGKTQVAIHYAYANRDAYQAGIWVNADSEQAITTSFSAIAHLLNLPQKNEENHRLLIEAVKRWLQNHDDWLLIFDNADTPDIIAPFLPATYAGQVLLTSRAPFSDILGISASTQLDVLEPDDALEFLCKRVGRADLDDAEHEAASTLVSELAGLPLALEQAGAYILANQTRFQDYLASYRKQHLALLNRREPKTGRYTENVATTWLMNFQEVERDTPASADVLRLSAFLSPDAIPFIIVASMATGISDPLSQRLQHVSDDPLLTTEILEPLTRFSLIRVNAQSQTFDIHRLVQTVVRDTMNAKEKRRWKGHAIAVVSRAFPDTVEFWSWVQCERLLDHLRVCTEYMSTDAMWSRAGARVLSVAGEYLRERARFAAAEPLLQLALDVWESEGGLEHPEVATSLSKLAVLYRAQGRYDEAEPLYRRAITILEDVLGPGHPDVAIRLSNLAVLYQTQGRYADAEPLFLRALAIREGVQELEYPDIAISLNKLAVLYRDQHRYEEAEPLFLRALAMRETELGLDHAAVSVSLNNLTILYRAQGRYEEAKEVAERALDIREQQMGPDHPDLAASLNNLALIYKAEGNYPEAEALFQRALAIREAALGPDHPDVAVGLTNLAVLFWTDGRYAEAKPLCTRALAIRELALGSNHPDVASSLNNLAVVHQAQGNDAEAELYFQQALGIREAVLGVNHPGVAEVLENYSHLLRKTQRDTEADHLDHRVIAIRQPLGLTQA